MDAKPSRHRDSAPATPGRLVRGHGPARARRLLDQLQQLASDWLHGPLQQALDDFATRLFETAEQTRRGADLQTCMDSREKVLQGRNAVEQRFVDGIARALDHVGETPDTAAPEPSNQPLSLVVPDEQELHAALEKVMARGAARGGIALFELGYRLAALIGAPPLEGSAQPLGPQSLTTAFHEAIKPLDLPDTHTLQLLTSFDNFVMRNIAPLYEQANRHLLDDGILPQLHAYAGYAQPNRGGSDAASPRTRRSSHRGDADTPGAPREPIAVLDNLRELLAQRRAGIGDTDSDNDLVATGDELQTALGALQQHCTQITDNAARELRSAKRLREELLAQLNANRPVSMPPARLSGEQSDTIELIAMLFEQLGKQVHEDRNTETMLGGMQLPILRMAVADHSFFEQQEHPARQLLETITEAAYDWLQAPGGKLDFGLEAKLEQLVERANSEPPTVALYRSLLADIEQYLNMLKLRAQAAERRQVEAMRARERLDEARQRAAELMAERFAVAEPHGLLRTLLDRAWTDVITLALLRHGEHNADCLAKLDITDQLLGLAPIIDRAQLQQDVQAGLRQIGMAVDEAAQVAERLVAQGKEKPPVAEGMSPTEWLIQLQHQQRLGEPPPAPAAAGRGPAPADAAANATPAVPAAPAPAASTPTANDAAATPPVPEAPSSGAQQLPVGRVTRPSATPATPTAAATVARANGTAEKSIRQRLAKLPFGTWFEFTDPRHGRTSQRKLAWYSPMSGQALFVTRRGQRAGQMSLDELAHRMIQGQVRELQPVRENMLDRAWRGLTGNLRRGGRPA